jgi:RHS repeat-associated protein
VSIPADHWTADCFSNPSLTGTRTRLVDEGTGFIDHWWANGAPSGLPADNFSARYTRTVTFPAGRYRFTIYTDDGSRLYIDGQLTINAWWDQNGSVPHEAEVDLAGAHTLRYEFYEHTGPARAYLSWQAQVGLTAPVAVHLRVASGQYVVAEGGGGGAVNADRWVTGSWETFTLEDLNGGVLQDGDPVAFRTSAGYYLQAVSGGGGTMLAPAQSVGAWETFTILNLAQVGAPIENDAAIALLSSGSYYACAENGGGSVVNVNRSVVGAWETFVLEVAGSPAVAAVADPAPERATTGPWVNEGGGPTSGATAFTVAPFSRGAPSSPPPPENEIVEYYHVDALGSVRVVTDAAGQVLRHHDFLPFGEEWQPPPSSPDQRLFTGKERDVESGLDYFGARYYRADLGRFTSVAPIQSWQDSTLQPQRWNRYTYGLNNPVRFDDPDGWSARDRVNAALDFRGYPYRSPGGQGNSNPRDGLDCAGLVRQVFKADPDNRINLDGSAEDEWKTLQRAAAEGKAVTSARIGDAQPGDAIFWKDKSGVIAHTGIVVDVTKEGAVWVVDASSPRGGVKHRPISANGNLSPFVDNRIFVGLAGRSNRSRIAAERAGK